MRTRNVILVLAATAGLLLAIRADAVKDAWGRALEVLRIVGSPVAVSQPVLSEAEIDRLSEASPQRQAERLLERAITGYQGATGYIESNVDDWRGEIEETPSLRAFFSAALNHTDLRVRAAGIETYLAAHGVEKTSEQVNLLEQDLLEFPNRRHWTLYVLGLLANRGVEPDRSFETLVAYLEDPDVEIRHWAIEGLAYSGDERQVPEMLRILRDDPSPRIQERAACSLAQSGMLTQEARMAAAPSILEIAELGASSEAVRRWGFQALRDITGQAFGEDAYRWDRWLSRQ